MAALILWAVGWAVDSRGVLTLAVIVCGIAITATVRTYFVTLDGLARNAFELGRDSVTPMRR